MEKQKTGLLLESVESAKAEGISHGAKSLTVRKKACSVTTVKIEKDKDAKKLGREKGTYITVEMDEMCRITDTDFDDIILVVSDTIRNLIKVPFDKRVLIVGIGNRNITHDSLGPKCIDRIIVTRGFEKIMPELISETGFANVCALSANVFGVTGIESAELISGISRVIDPALVIVIDALATSNVNRLCKTIQISNTSLIPGGGVGNDRKKINKEVTGASVLSIGMPTVMNLDDFIENSDIKHKNFTDDLVITPMNINSSTDLAAKLIAFSINKALHYDMTTEEILKFLY